jgi:hypothetical protein
VLEPRKARRAACRQKPWEWESHCGNGNIWLAGRLPEQQTINLGAPANDLGWRSCRARKFPNGFDDKDEGVQVVSVAVDQPLPYPGVALGAVLPIRASANRSLL